MEYRRCPPKPHHKSLSSLSFAQTTLKYKQKRKYAAETNSRKSNANSITKRVLCPVQINKASVPKESKQYLPFISPNPFYIISIETKT